MTLPLVQDSPVDTDLVFIVAYSCPRCHAALEARSSGPPAWLRCPECGRACLPPEPDHRSGPASLDEETYYIGQHRTGGPSMAPLPIRPREMAPLPASEAPRTPPSRLVLGTGAFLSTLISVFALLESSIGRAGIFLMIAVACLIGLTRMPFRPRSI